LKTALVAAATTTTPPPPPPPPTTTSEKETSTATSRPKHNQCVFLFWKVPAIEVVKSKDKGSKPDTAEQNELEVEALRSSTQVMGKEVKQVELRLHSAEQKLRDLNINIR